MCFEMVLNLIFRVLYDLILSCIGIVYLWWCWKHMPCRLWGVIEVKSWWASLVQGRTCMLLVKIRFKMDTLSKDNGLVILHSMISIQGWHSNMWWKIIRNEGSLEKRNRMAECLILGSMAHSFVAGSLWPEGHSHAQLWRVIAQLLQVVSCRCCWSQSSFLTSSCLLPREARTKVSCFFSDSLVFLCWVFQLEWNRPVVQSEQLGGGWFQLKQLLSTVLQRWGDPSCQDFLQCCCGQLSLQYQEKFPLLECLGFFRGLLVFGLLIQQA